MSRSRTAWLAAGLFLLALTLRWLYLAEIRALANYLILDSRFYYLWAENLLAGHWIGDRVFDQSPLYAYLLAATLGVVRAVPGVTDPLLWVRALQSVIGALSCLVLVRLARSAGAGRIEAWLAGLLAALYAPFLYYDTMVMKTFLATFLSLLCLLFLYRSEGRRQRDLVITGALFGLTSLVRDNFVLMLPFLWIGMWPLLSPPRWRPARRAAAWMLAGAAVIIVPVAVRNTVIGGELSLLSAGGGEVFYIGNNPQADGRYRPPCIEMGNQDICVRADPQYEHDDFRRIASGLAGHELSPMQSSRFWLRKGAGFLVSHPVRAGGLYLRKLGIFLKNRELGDNYDFHIFQKFSRVLSLPLPTFGWMIGPALFGMVVAWQRRRRFALLYAATFGYIGTVLLFFNFSRFRIPAVPLLLIFAAIGLCWLAGQFVTLWRTVQAEGFGGGIRTAAILMVLVLGVSSISYWSLRKDTPTLLVSSQRQMLLADLLREVGRPRRALAEYQTAKYFVGDAPIEERLDLLGGDSPERFRFTLQEEKLAQGLNFRIVHSRLYEGMGLARQEMGDLTGAVADFEESTKIFLDGPTVLLRLGTLYEELDRFSEAAEAYRRALKIEDRFGPRFDLAGILLRTGQPGPAYQLLAEAPDTLPDMSVTDMADYHFGLGLILLDGLGRPEEARRHFESCLQLAPEHPQAGEIRNHLQRIDRR